MKRMEPVPGAQKYLRLTELTENEDEDSANLHQSVRMEQKWQVDGYIFDLDGTLYLGERVLPYAVETIRALRERDKRVLFVSNKPLEPRQNYAEKLSHLGIPASAEEVITSGL
jgi:FMN phosphatase YigB (HAD superfamily)